MDDRIRKSLECPITLDLLDDPVNTPCCSRAFSRQALLQLPDPKVCPTCKADISSFDIRLAPKNVNLAGMVDDLRMLEKKHSHEWQCTLRGLATASRPLNVWEVTLSIFDAAFVSKPALLLAVVDRSGSMSGRPWAQVQVALSHFVAVSAHRPGLVTRIIAYDSMATILPTENQDVESILAMIKQMSAGGGTFFDDAFRKIGAVLGSGSFGSASIVFLTDGQDSKANVDILRNVVIESSIPVTVHTVGFGGGCDRNLLELIRKAGSLEGVFRYAEPNGEDDDTLCEKLKSCFSFASTAGSVVDVQVALTGAKTLDGSSTLRLPFSVNSKNHGAYNFWVTRDEQAFGINVTSAVDENKKIESIQTIEAVFSQDRLDSWLSVQTDLLATELMEVAGEEKKDIAFELHLCLLQKKIDCIFLASTKGGARLQYLREQIGALLQGRSINLGKLAEVRFGSKFEAPTQTRVTTTQREAPKLVEKKAVAQIDELKPHYATSYDLQTVFQAGLIPLDDHFNTALHLAAYRGRVDDVKSLLATFHQTDVNAPNLDDETPLTLAVKGKGYYKTLEVLLQHGAHVPISRFQGLKRYSLDRGYEVTLRSLLQDAGVNAVDSSCSESVLLSTFNGGIADRANIDFQLYLSIACEKQLLSFIACLFTQHGAKATRDLFIEYCIPKKPDDPNVAIFLAMAKLFLERDPTLIAQRDPEDMETPLFKATERGNLPIVKYFLDCDPSLIDVPNKLLNTPLWVACAKAYPCIIDELVLRRADVNRSNGKGNPPMYNVCQRGPVKVAIRLLASRANIDWVNNNGDTPVLLAARNGQAGVLALLLDYVTLEVVNRPAHIDGFNALFASAEQDRANCIQALVDKHPDIDIEQRTAVDNAILPDATPLHLAAFYGRAKAAQKLLELKASVHARDKNAASPLHVAVLQGHEDVIKFLIGAGADVQARDTFNNTPLSYAKSKPQIYKLLKDPLLDILMKLAMNQVSSEQIPGALKVIQDHCSMSDFITAAEMLDCRDHDGSTPLMQAVMHTNLRVCKTLVTMGCKLKNVNAFGLSSWVFAHWIRNARVLDFVSHSTQGMDYDSSNCVFLSRLQSLPAEQQCLLSLPMLPRENCNPTEGSGFRNRMSMGLKTFTFVEESERKQKPLLIQDTSFPLEQFEDERFVNFSKTNIVFYAQLQLVNLMASARNKPLSPSELMCLLMFTNNSEIAHFLNVNHLALSPIAQNFAGALSSALSKLPNHVGEVFMATPVPLARGELHVGKTIMFAHYVFASTLFAVALEAVPDLTTKAKRGTVFLVKSKTGKFVAPYTQFQYDAEVIFSPSSRFKITHLYHGDNAIVLGQENIREHTFAIKQDEWNSIYVNSQRSLVIELEEIE